MHRNIDAKMLLVFGHWASLEILIMEKEEGLGSGLPVDIDIKTVPLVSLCSTCQREKV